ncbi:Melanopsin-B, partial [Larimichthys crocea]
DVVKLGSQVRKSSLIQQQSIATEWKLAKIAFVVIIVFVLSWSPYACVTLIAWAGYGSILNPYSKAVPAVIAKASAIYNPFIYAIIHSKYRDTLAEKVPCLHFLSQASRRDCMSVSHSESSFRDSVLSRQSSVSKANFHRVSSMSTTDTQLWSDVELDPIDHRLRSSYSLGGLRDKEYNSLAKQTNKMGSQSQEQTSIPERGPMKRCDHNISPESFHTIMRREEENPQTWKKEKQEHKQERESEQKEEQHAQKEIEEKEALIQPDTLENIVCLHTDAIITPGSTKSPVNHRYCEEQQSTQNIRKDLLLNLQSLDSFDQLSESVPGS